MPTSESFTSNSTEREWLRQAVELAVDNVESGGGPFGAVIIKDQAVIGTGTNRVTPTSDPTAHAEVVAIRDACRRIEHFQLTGCVLVSSCEPCPLCLAAALWSRVDRIVYCADRHDAAVAGFDDREFYELFSRPRSVWPTRVEHVDIADRTAPFVAWQEKPDRVRY